MTARRIVFVIFDGLQPIDLVGPQVRIESARRALAEAEDPVDAIARPAASAPPRRCAGCSSAASASPRPSTATGSA